MKQNFKENKLIHIAVIVYLIWVSIFIGTRYVSEKDQLYRSIDVQLNTAAARLPLLLPDNFHHQAMHPGDISRQQSLEQVLKLSDFTRSHDVAYIYSLVLRDNKVYFTASSATDEEIETDEGIDSYLEHYEDVDPGIFEVFRSEQKAYLEYTDHRGDFRSVFIPLRSPDGTLYVVGADIKISHIDDLLRDGFLKSWGVAALCLLFVILLVLAFNIRSRRLINSLELRVQKRTKEINKRADALSLAASVFSQARQGIMISDTSGSIVEVNNAFTDITGYSREEAIGQNPRFLQSGRQSPEFYAEMWKSLLEKGHWKGEVWNRSKRGDVYAELLTISTVRNADGQEQNYVALFSDITQIKDYQGQLERMAHYDVLTNLPNRVLLADRLTQAMVQSQRYHNSLAVAFLDLDGFKAVNDRHGHTVGDELLIIVTQRMKEALREGDTFSRVGGDEFVAVLADLANVQDCQPVLERLLLAASKPITVGEIVLHVSASIGVTLYPQDGADADILMRHADQAMYLAKQAGKNRYHWFDTAQDEAVNIRRESIGNIRSALERREFVLFYQPKVNMQTGKVVGVEALIRWQHPVRGLVPPFGFLPIIEGHAISLDIGEWVIDTALSQISQWQKMGFTPPISVNISAYQLQQANFIERLASLLVAHPDVSPHDLELEVLETSALSDINNVSETMQACLELGVHFALDDFGTGYSSLTHLRRLPASIIKIDQSFVRDMLTDPDDLAIVEGVIALAKLFKREVIAEGVETIEHGTALLQLGCDLAQGYGIARPMPASDIPAWINDWKPDDAW